MTISFFKKQNMGREAGFTLIELLVVIAIIGILSAITLATLNQARRKANIASAKAELSSMRAEAELYYTDNYDYAGVCTNQLDGNGNEVDVNPYALYREAGSDVGIKVDATGAPAGCNVDTGGTAWAAGVELETGKWFCADSTGFAGESIALSGTRCEDWASNQP